MSSELFKVKNAYDEAILQLEEVRRFFEKRKNDIYIIIFLHQGEQGVEL